MSDQILKLFNITPHVFLSEKDMAGRSIDTDSLNEIWHNKIINNIYPNTQEPESHDIGGVILSLPYDDMLRFIKFLTQHGLLSPKLKRFFDNAINSRRLHPCLNLKHSNEELVNSEKLFLSDGSESEICGSVCSKRIPKSDRPSRCMDLSDILSTPPWWRGPKLGPTVIFTEDFINDKLSNLLGFAKTFDYFDNFLLKKIDVKNGEYSEIIKIFSLIGSKSSEKVSITIHVQVASGKGKDREYNVTPEYIENFRSYLDFHSNLLLNVSKIAVKQWSYSHDRNICTNLGGFVTGVGLKNPTRSETSFNLLSFDDCNTIKRKYNKTNRSRLNVRGEKFEIHPISFPGHLYPDADKNEIVVFSS